MVKIKLLKLIISSVCIFIIHQSMPFVHILKTVIKKQKFIAPSQRGVEPRTFGLEVQRASPLRYWDAS